MDHLESAMDVKDQTADDEASWINNTHHTCEHTPRQNCVAEATSTVDNKFQGVLNAKMASHWYIMTLL